LKPGRIVFLATFALLVAVNGRFFISARVHEKSDFAVNALQIDQAKALREIHGNYSRFGFDHPGPAFFYVYALGEGLFHDLLHLTASPDPAHLLAGLALQSAFFALALGILASWIRSPLFLPLALAGAAIHYSLASNVFLSIWPPHALVMPFLAFWAASVSVAAGRGRDLPWAVLAGSFLVHGHVAQPLFVVVLFLGSYLFLALGLVLSEKAPVAPWRAFKRAHLVALAILLLFLIPLGLDLLRGGQSNFNSILRQWHYSQGQRKPLADSLLYFLSFFAYIRNQDEFLGIGSPAHLHFLREHAMLYAAWAVALGVAATVLFLGSRRIGAQTLRFLRIMAVFWAATVALCLEWGVLQTGPMFDFNGYFFYSVIYAGGLIACALAAEAIPRFRHRWPGVVLIGTAVAAASVGLRTPVYPRSDSDIGLLEASRAALRADEKPDEPKLLVFAHDDWGKAASVGLALERAGVAFYVDPAWAFMFQAAHELPAPLLDDPSASLRVWRFIHGNIDSPSVPVEDGIRIAFQPATLSPDRGVIDFSTAGNLEGYAFCGFATPERDFAWTDLPDAVLQFRPLPARHDVLLRLTSSPYLFGRKLPAQRVEFWFNGVRLLQATLEAPSELQVRVPSDLWNRIPTATLRLHLPNARSPASLKLENDPRLLGLRVMRLTTSGP
jgi:hypothetical protein